MNRYLYIFFFSCLPLMMHALTPALSANDAYRAADYHKAVDLYEQALKHGASAEVYYNLGNSYYRIDNIPKALLCYEKANKIRPLDSDILHNIEIARGKTIDKMPQESEVFFIGWYHWLQSRMTVDGWAYTALASFIVALLSFLAYLFLENITMRRFSFCLSVLLLLSCVISNVFAWQRIRILSTNDTAIVMNAVVPVKVSPTLKATDTCIIHEGTKVRIIDKDMENWYGIKLSDGREGWIMRKDVEGI